MKRTKKSLLATVALITICASAQLVIGCNKESTNNNTFRTEFNTNKGSNISIKYGTINNEPIPTRTGYEFAGWFTDSDLKGNRVEFPYIPENDGELYAAWELTDEKAAVIQVFKDKYNNQSDLYSFEKMTYENEKYIYERNATPSDNITCMFRFTYNSKYDTFEITANEVFTFSGNGNRFYRKVFTNNSFNWGKFDSGFSILNEVSYYKYQGINLDLYLIQTNLYNIKTISHDKNTATIEFTPNTNNGYSRLQTYHITDTQQDEEASLQYIYNQSIIWTNDFLYRENITI